MHECNLNASRLNPKDENGSSETAWRFSKKKSNFYGFSMQISIHNAMHETHDK